jgi:pimeloyl-ACP methyl ester carboxylesterase
VAGSNLTLLPGVGHAPWIDDPGTVARVTTSFLRSHPVG